MGDPATKHDESVINKKRYGQLVHHILSQTSQLKDLDKLMLELYYKGIISRQDQKQLKQIITDFLQNEKVKEWFTDQWQVKTEMPILDEKGNTYRPDRVLVDKDIVLVVDYKTGKETEKRKNLLNSMGYNQVQGYLAYVLEGTIEEVSQ